ncbi:MAG: hypothetical protein QXU32_05480, partial [Nitrososphaerales archaeon]
QPKLQLEKSPFTYKVSKTIFRQGITTLPAAVAIGRRLSCFHILIAFHVSILASTSDIFSKETRLLIT